MPSTTRQPLPPATEVLEAFHIVGSHVYIVRYRPGQEELARESIYRFSRNKELAFSWTDAAVMGEQVPYVPEEECDCRCCPQPYIAQPLDSPLTFAHYIRAVFWMAAVAFPLVCLVLAGRWVWGVMS